MRLITWKSKQNRQDWQEILTAEVQPTTAGRWKRMIIRELGLKWRENYISLKAIGGESLFYFVQIKYTYKYLGEPIYSCAQHIKKHQPRSYFL